MFIYRISGKGFAQQTNANIEEIYSYAAEGCLTPSKKKLSFVTL
jgi:hypothetical protein